MLATVHSLLVYQSLNGVYSDGCDWSVSDLDIAVDQLHAINCDLQSVDDVTQILTHVYTSRCYSQHDADKIQAFIIRLITAWTSNNDVNVEFITSLRVLTSNDKLLWCFCVIMFHWFSFLLHFIGQSSFFCNSQFVMLILQGPEIRAWSVTADA